MLWFLNTCDTKLCIRPLRSWNVQYLIDFNFRTCVSRWLNLSLSRAALWSTAHSGSWSYASKPSATTPSSATLRKTSSSRRPCSTRPQSDSPSSPHTENHQKKKKIQTGLHTHNLCLCVFSVHRLKITNQGRVKVEYVWQVIMESAPPDIGTGVSQEGISFYQS